MLFAAVVITGCGLTEKRHALIGGGVAGTLRTDDNDGFGPSVIAGLSDEKGDQVRLVVARLQTDDSDREELWQVELGSVRGRPRTLSQRPGPLFWESGVLFHFGDGDIWGIGLVQVYGVAVQTARLRAELGAGFSVWLGDVDDRFDAGAEVLARGSVLVKF